MEFRSGAVVPGSVAPGEVGAAWGWGPDLDGLAAEEPGLAGVVSDAGEVDYWCLVGDLVEGGYDPTGGGGRGWPGEELSAGLVDARRGLGRAGLTGEEVGQVFDSGISSGLEGLAQVWAAADGAVVRLVLEGVGRGLHTEKGLSVVDWVRARCVGMGGQEASWVGQVVKCCLLVSGAPLAEAVCGGRVPLHRAAMVARVLNRIAPALEDPARHEGYVRIMTGAAGDLVGMSDRDLQLACEKLVRDLLDDEPGRERTAQELRGVSRRVLGEGLTRFTVDAPDECAAVLDGIITGALAAPAPGVDGHGDPVPDPRTARQRRFDALMMVTKRGLSDPGGAPATGRATVIVTIPFDPATGRPAGAGVSAGGLIISPAAAGQLACTGEITPVWVGPGMSRWRWCGRPGSPRRRSGRRWWFGTGTARSRGARGCRSGATPIIWTGGGVITGRPT